jgi:ankyrin repeat protein
MNSLDSIGRTPLSMAAERSEVGYVTTLLTFGADPMLGSYSDQTPLHYAASAKEPECIQQLLQAGAEVDSLTNWDQTPLHLAAAYTKDARHATLLLDAGANPNIRDRDGITPLGWTATSNNPGVTSVLLDRGADVHDLDLQGSSTLQQCIRSNRHEILRLLVPKAPRVKECFAEHQSIWNVIAVSADVETMQILRQLDFTSVPADVEVAADSPALDILLNRSDSSPELTAAFQDLVRRVRARQHWEVETDEEEIWEDAMEAPD